MEIVKEGKLFEGAEFEMRGAGVELACEVVRSFVRINSCLLGHGMGLGTIGARHKSAQPRLHHFS